MQFAHFSVAPLVLLFDRHVSFPTIAQLVFGHCRLSRVSSKISFVVGKAVSGLLSSSSSFPRPVSTILTFQQKLEKISIIWDLRISVGQ